MIDCLPAVNTRVHDRSEAIFQLLRLGDPADLKEEASKYLCIARLRYIGNMILGKNQYMRRRLRTDISDRYVVIIFAYYS